MPTYRVSIAGDNYRIPPLSTSFHPSSLLHSPSRAAKQRFSFRGSGVGRYEPPQSDRSRQRFLHNHNLMILSLPVKRPCDVFEQIVFLNQYAPSDNMHLGGR